MKSLRVTNRITNRDTDSFRQYLNEISTYEPFTPEQEAEYALRANKGDKEAVDELIKRNLRFVISIAKQYEMTGVNLEDLVNEGNIGLIMAVDKYNVSTGFKFITYAVFWIRKMICEYLAKNSRIVRLPLNKIDRLSKLNQQITALEQKLGGTVDISQVAEEIDGGMSEDEIKDLESFSMLSFESLDTLLGDGESTSNLYDIIPDDGIKSTDYLITDADLKKQIKGILHKLKPRDKRVITALYGLDGSNPLTLKEVAEDMDLTRERVRQIKEKSLTVLRKAYMKQS